MKNIIYKILGALILTTIIFSNIIVVNASQNCPITENHKYIEYYLKNVHKVVQNINNEVNKADSKDFLKTKLETIYVIAGSLNRLFNWKSYETDIEYTISQQKNEIPPQVQKDIILLQKESDNIKLAKAEGANIEIDGSKICKGIENCDFKPNQKYRAIKVIELLKKSTNKLRDIIKNQVNEKIYKNDEKLLFIKTEDILKIYSKENIKKCNLTLDNNGNKGFFATIFKRIQKLTQLETYTKDGLKDWKEAINLILGNTNSIEYKKKEKELLARELQRQGIGGDSAGVILSNLDAFNNSKPGDFPFLQGKQGFFNSLQLQIDEFEEVLEKEFPGYKKGNPINNVIPIEKIPEEIKKLKNIELQNINIKSEYNKLKSFTIDDNIKNDQLISKMLDIDLSISKMINTLNKTCPIAVKVCNDQKKGLGDCGQCY